MVDDLGVRAIRHDAAGLRDRERENRIESLWTLDSRPTFCPAAVTHRPLLRALTAAIDWPGIDLRHQERAPHRPRRARVVWGWTGVQVAVQQRLLLLLEPACHNHGLNTTAMVCYPHSRIPGTVRVSGRYPEYPDPPRGVFQNVVVM